MTLTMIALLIFLIIGVGLTIYGLIGMSKMSDTTVEYVPKSADLDETYNDVDKVMTELSNFTESVFKDVDEKYQELMFLYSLVDEKKQELAEAYNNPSPQTKSVSTQKTPRNVLNTEENLTQEEFESVSVQDVINDKPEPKKVEKKQKIGFVDLNPKYKKIMELEQENYSVAEIARELEIGQREVQLIIELIKGN